MLQVAVIFLCGLPSTIDAGPMRGEGGTTCKMLIPALSVTNTPKQSIIFSPVVFAREVWHMVLSKCNLQSLTPSLHNSELIPWWLRSRKLMGKALRKSFDSLVILVAWTLWKERNQRVFQRANLSAPELCNFIMDEIRVWGYAGIADFQTIFTCLPLLNVSRAVRTLGRAWNDS